MAWSKDYGLEARNAAQAAEQAATEAQTAAQAAIDAKDDVTTKWLEAVATVALRDSTYPNPQNGDTVRVTSTSTVYRYQTGTGWVVTDEYDSSAIDNVTAQLADIEQTKADKSQTTNLQSQVNSIVLQGTSGDSSAEVAQARIDSKGNAFPTVKNHLDNIELIINERTSLVGFTWKQGTINVNGEATSTTRIRSDEYLESSLYGNKLKFEIASGYQYNIIHYDISKVRINESGWITTSQTLVLNNPFIRVLLSKQNGTTIIPSESINIVISEEIDLLLDNEVGNSKLAPRAVTADKTTFANGDGQYNLFNGDYSKVFIESGRVHRGETNPFGAGFIMRIEGGRDYFIRKGVSNRFRAAFHRSPLDLTNAISSSMGIVLDYVIPEPISQGSALTAPLDAQFLVVYVSNDGIEPDLQVTVGQDRPFFLGYGVEIDLAPESVPTKALKDRTRIESLFEIEDRLDFKNVVKYHFLGNTDTIYESNITLDSIDLTTTAKVYEFYDSLVSQYPNYVSREDRGVDSLGNPMYSYVFRAPSIVNQSTHDIDRLKIIVSTGVHGGEKQTVLAVCRFFKELCENPRDLDSIEAIKWNVDFSVLPVCNPTGYNTNSRVTSTGVNLNRNFPSRWSYSPPVNSDYGGDAPLDAIESQNIATWLNDNLDAYYYIDYHAHIYTDAAIYIEDVQSATISQSVLRQYEKRWRELNGTPETYTLTSYILEPGRGFLVGYAKTLGINILLPETPWFGFYNSPMVEQRIVLEYFNNIVLSILKRV